MITVKCQTCGKSIKKYPSHAKKGRGKFCSKECYYKSLTPVRITDLSTTKVCTGCGKEKPLTDYPVRNRAKKFGRSAECNDCNTNRAMDYYYSHREESCAKSKINGKLDRAQNPEKFAKRKAEASDRIWKEAIDFFGPCECCGESRKEFLSVDHRNGHGNEVRKATKKRAGVYLLRHFSASNWPEELKTEYRLLCMNCNFAIGHNGFCPHHPEKKYAYWNPSKRQWENPNEDSEVT